MISEDRETLALLLGCREGCIHIQIEHYHGWSADPRNDKIVSTTCRCPKRTTKQTYKNNICKYWKQKT